MNRQDLQKLAELRLHDVETLMSNKSFQAAYYLSGYIIECALKAAIAKQVKQYDFPDKNTVLDSYTHDLSKLLGLAGLDTQLDKDKAKNTDLNLNWTIVKDWSEESRYSQHITEQEARDLLQSIADSSNGVLQWVKKCMLLLY